MHEVMHLAHKFLQSFCLSNQANQAILHQSLDLFLTPGVSIFASVYLLSLIISVHELHCFLAIIGTSTIKASDRYNTQCIYAYI